VGLAERLTGRRARSARTEPVLANTARASTGLATEPPTSGAGHPLIGLVTRFMTAQTVCSAAVGLFYSRRHLPSIIITLSLVAVLVGLVLLVRTGTHTAWLTAIGLESIYLIFGLYRFATSRYLGGTLLAIVTLGVLLAPSVARAFGGAAGRDQGFGESELADSAST
jgi:ribose/xylose/arabinose/galactoside ABC-type transport system permease subunit